jgi:hypothetical protein
VEEIYVGNRVKPESPIKRPQLLDYTDDTVRKYQIKKLNSQEKKCSTQDVSTLKNEENSLPNPENITQEEFMAIFGLVHISIAQDIRSQQSAPKRRIRSKKERIDYHYYSPADSEDAD